MLCHVGRRAWVSARMEPYSGILLSGFVTRFGRSSVMDLPRSFKYARLLADCSDAPNHAQVDPPLHMAGLRLIGRFVVVILLLFLTISRRALLGGCIAKVGPRTQCIYRRRVEYFLGRGQNYQSRPSEPVGYDVEWSREGAGCGC